MSIQIRVVRDATDMRAVCRLRYKVYVEEMSKVQKHADHRNREICEPLDQQGVVFGAFEGDDCVATVRTNFIRNGVGEYWNYYRLDEFPLSMIDCATMTTKLLVMREHRHSTVGMRVSKAAYQHALDQGMDFDFIDCNPQANTQPFFEKMGYRKIFPNFHHVEFGEATPLLLVVSDYQHLKSVGSPFARLLQSARRDLRGVEMFRAWLDARSNGHRLQPLAA